MAKLVSKTYGDALFELALEEHKIDEFYEEIKAVEQALSADQDLNKLMDHPKIVKEEKIRIMEEIFGKLVSRELTGFIVLLITKDHYKDISSVFEHFTARVKEYKKIGIAYVQSAVVLTEEQKKQVEQRLLETTSYETFEMNFSVDEKIIGGLIIRIGDRVVDSSIRTKIYELSRNLSKIQLA